LSYLKTLIIKGFSLLHFDTSSSVVIEEI